MAQEPQQVLVLVFSITLTPKRVRPPVWIILALQAELASVRALLVKGLDHSNLPSTLELVCDVLSLLHANSLSPLQPLHLHSVGLECLDCGRALENSMRIVEPQDGPIRSSVGVEWLGVRAMRARGLLLCRRISPCLGPSLRDVRNYDTPVSRAR